MDDAPVARRHRLERDGLALALGPLTHRQRHALQLLAAAGPIRRDVQSYRSRILDPAGDQAVDEILQRVEGLAVAADQNPRAVTLDIDMDRFIVGGQHGFGLRPHKVEDFLDQPQRFPALLLEVGAAAARTGVSLFRLRLDRFERLHRLGNHLLSPGEIFARRCGRLSGTRRFGRRAGEGDLGGADGNGLALRAASGALRLTRTRAGRAPSPSRPERGVASTSMETSASSAPSWASASRIAASTLAPSVSM